MVPPDFTDSVSSVMNTLLSSIGETPFMKRSVREMLFEGWSLKPYITLLEQLSDLAGIPLPIPIPEDFNPTFGYYTGVSLSRDQFQQAINLKSFSITLAQWNQFR